MGEESPSSKKKVKFQWGNLLSLNVAYPHVELTKDVYLLGRSKDCDFTFTLDSISNRHCSITKTDNGDDNEDPQVFIEDLSSNGTYINGKKIGKGKKALLKHGDEIQLSIRKDPADPLADKFYLFQFPRKNHPKTTEEPSTSTRRITDHYEIQKVLGTGNFAEVKLGIDKVTGEKFAIKVIDKVKYWEKPKFFEALQREVEILMTVQHPNIVSIVDYYDEENTLYLVMEYMSGGDLFDRIVKKSRLSEKEAKLVFYQLLLGVKYLHDQDIAHRDLKPENILLADNSDDYPLKITDFGLARIIGENSFMKTQCGTPFYLAPDVLQANDKTGYNKSVDLWSLGVVLFIALAGYPPFSDERKDHTLEEQVKRGLYQFHPTYWDPISAEAKDLVRKLLDTNAKTRLTIEQALEHPWIKKDVPKLKGVHKKVAKRSDYAPESLKRVDTAFPVTLARKDEKGKSKDDEEEEEEEEEKEEEKEEEEEEEEKEEEDEEEKSETDKSKDESEGEEKEDEEDDEEEEEEPKPAKSVKGRQGTKFVASKPKSKKEK